MTALIGIGAFVLVTVAEQAGWAGKFDHAAARVAHAVASGRLDALATAISIAFSFEAVLVYAAVGTLLLWRRGSGLWSLTPFGFLLLTLVEIALKLTLVQEPIPAESYRAISYPLVQLQFPGSYPSGHAIRIAFACTLCALAVWRGAGRHRNLIAAAFLAAAVPLALSRVYLGHHWLSDVVGGLILGGTLAATLAPSMAWRRESPVS
jgi:undecaprenyl-diphosphatase